MIQQLNENNFDENVKDGVKFVAFTADWCGFCQKQKPVLEDISNNNIWVGDVNADENPKLTKKYGIQAFPSFLLFKEGKPIAQFAGYKSKYDLLNTLLSYLK